MKNLKRIGIVVMSFVFSVMLVGTAVVTSAFAQENEANKIVHANLADYQCNNLHWLFVINGLDGTATRVPPSISMAWENGIGEVVPLEKTDGTIAYYRRGASHDSPVTLAKVEIYESWSGEFKLLEGPCVNPDPTGTPAPTPTNTPGPTATPGPGSNSGGSSDSSKSSGEVLGATTLAKAGSVVDSVATLVFVLGVALFGLSAKRYGRQS